VARIDHFELAVPVEERVRVLVIGVVEVRNCRGVCVILPKPRAAEAHTGVCPPDQSDGSISPSQVEVRPHLPSPVRYLAVDGACARNAFVPGCGAVGVAGDQQAAL
jgi:hypothetical protein